MKLLKSVPNSVTPSLPEFLNCQNYLKRIVKELSFPRDYGSAANKTAANLIFDEFFYLGLNPKIKGEIENIVAGDPDGTILIGAHYDSVPETPGADDNASAVAVMLAVAKFFGDKSGIRYVAFNSEEYNLAGSREYAKNLKGDLEQVHILEMVGYTDKTKGSQKNPLPMVECPDTGDFLGLVSNNKDLVNDLIKTAGCVNIPVVGLELPENIPLKMIEQISPHILRSDHASFWEKGFDAVMWTDTSEFRNPHYHQETDTPETLDYEFMEQITKLMINFVGSKIL